MRRKQIAKHLDKRELIGPGLLIKYQSERPPDKSTKGRLIEAASVACSVMRKTVWEIDKVSLFHRDEDELMTRVLDNHFGFKNDSGLTSRRDAKQKMVNLKARRKMIATIRANMLSISFHLNTGMYLLDTDAGHRTIVGDNEIDDMDPLWAQEEIARDSKGKKKLDPNDPNYYLMQPKLNAQNKKVLSENIEAYANTGSSGPVHVSFELAKTYSALQFARLIVHEASHTFCGTSDVWYAHADAQYYNEMPHNMVNNADSYAYAAVSIGAKAFHGYASLQGAAYKP